MTTLTVPVYLLLLHYVADFLLQSDWMATNKSKLNSALLLHVMVYSLCFLPVGLVFSAVTFVTHALTDAVTSRTTSKLWALGLRHWFFVMIGLDQVIHYVTLALTYRWLCS